jgi:hypothetical protein
VAVSTSASASSNRAWRRLSQMPSTMITIITE